MRTPDFKIILREPVKTGIITAFSALSSAAAINLATSVVLGSASAPGTAGLMLACAVSGVAGAVAATLSSRVLRRESREFEMAEALAQGDFSKCISHDISTASPLMSKLHKIAERALEIETERARLLKDAANRQDQLADALDAIPDAVAVYSRDNLLVSANTMFVSQCNEAGAVVALGMTRQDVLSAIAKAPRTNLPVNERQTWVNFQEGMRRDALASGVPIRFARFNNNVAEIHVSLAQDGNQTEIIRDVTAIVELEDRASRAQREATASQSIKQLTLSRLSHTIRTPMTGVLAATELLGETNLDPRQRERLDIIRRSASTLLGVVQDMFDMASNNHVEPVEPLLATNNQRSALALNLPEASITEDIDRLSNEGFEVGNAESVEILIEALKVLATRNRNPELILVPDMASHAALQDALERANISVRPEIRLAKFAVSKPNGMKASAPSQSTALDVLIAEGDEINQIAFANALSGSGLSYQICSKGKEAIEIAKSRSPKLLLIDISLPDMDGFETTGALRKLDIASRRLGPIVAMTSHYVQGDMAKCLANGMDGYVLKPTVGEDMVRLSEDWLSREHMKKAG